MKAVTSQELTSDISNCPFASPMEDPSHESGSSSIPSWFKPSTTLVFSSAIEVPNTLITPPPELRLREAIPEPQADCGQLQNSADQAVRQANQQASESVRQASESARQASQQAQQSADAATRSATDAIRQANQSASQAIAAASRTASQAMQSASQAVTSIQASAADAISRASSSLESAKSAQSSAQADASQAILQAGAAVAAATGKAAAAGSSFLQAAALATKSADAQSAAAASKVAEANLQASTSQTVAITATQVAIAIVGSIIASALITILLYFLIIKHKERSKKRKEKEQQINNDQKSPDTARAFEAVRGYTADSKFPPSDQAATTVNGPPTSRASFSLFPRVNPPNNETPPIKTTSVPWNPSKPPAPPSLGSWLKLHDTVSPFGPIALPTDKKSPLPLGGQLKSPLQDKSQRPATTAAPAFKSSLPLRSPKIPKLAYRNPKSPPVINRQDSLSRRPVSPSIPEDKPSYRESKASVWTDALSNTTPTPRNAPNTTTQTYDMELPAHNKPIRTTAEWLQDQQRSPYEDIFADPISSPEEVRPRPKTGLPSNPRLGLPTGPRSAVSRDSGEIGMARESRFYRVSKFPSAETPGVGKAL